MAFILLHDDDNNEVIVNTENVNYFRTKDYGDESSVSVRFRNQDEIYVTETPSEIMELIEISRSGK